MTFYGKTFLISLKRHIHMKVPIIGIKYYVTNILIKEAHVR